MLALNLFQFLSILCDSHSWSSNSQVLVLVHLDFGLVVLAVILRRQLLTESNDSLVIDFI